MSTICCRSPSFTPCSTSRKTRPRRSNLSSRRDPRDGGENGLHGEPGSEHCHPECLYRWQSRLAFLAWRQRLKNPRAIGTTPATARVPSWTSFVVTVITRGDVVESSRRESNALVQIWIEITHRLAGLLIQHSNQAGP